MHCNNYLERDMAFHALKKMQRFHQDLNVVMENYNFNLFKNLGRRNSLLSQAQEKFFAEELAKKYAVTSSGRTGEPDIIIECLGKELECKLASPQKNGSIGFQTDYETLLKKGNCDYLYVIANKNFEKFAVFHYNNLTIEDFNPLANGARGKVSLRKHKAYNKLNTIIGDMIEINSLELKKLNNKINKAKTLKQKNKILKSINYWKNQPSKYKIKMVSL
jgi:hypothetical protein